jgi:hypothetical protein
VFMGIQQRVYDQLLKECASVNRRFTWNTWESETVIVVRRDPLLGDDKWNERILVRVQR